MNNKPETFQLNIPLKTHLQADKFRRYQSQRDKAEQVYLNTLGVSVVNSYLNLLGWSTSLEQSDSWNPVAQTMMDVADLCIPSYGKLECRVVPFARDWVTIPPEVWSERIGYVVVMLDKSLKIGTVLGFVKRVDRENLSLDQLESLAEFPTYLSQQRSIAPVQTANLSAWRRGIKEHSWQKLDELFARQMVMNFRNPPELATLANRSSDIVSRVKLVNLGEETEHKIALILNVQCDNRLEYNVSVTVCNYQTDNYLPQELEVVIIDCHNLPVMNAQASETETIEFCFSGELGESFSVEISLADQFKVEKFII